MEKSTNRRIATLSAAAMTFAVLAAAAGASSAARLPEPPIFSTVQHYPSICYLPPDSGICLEDDALSADNNVDAGRGASSAESSSSSVGERQTHYFFDMATEQCYPFGTQNCGGNENRFETLADCQARCRTRN